jgi:Tfp pilus assembly protein PilF
LGRHTGATAAQLYRQAGTVVLSEPGLRQAMLLLDGAIAQQPDFAPAFVARAEVRVGIGLLGYAPPDVLEGAERDAHRALALQPGLNTANAVLGITNSYRGNWLDAEAQFHTALAAADPGAAVRAEYATFCLGSAGHLQQALQELNRAYRLAPSSQSTVVLLAAMNALAGHEDAAYRLAVLARDLGYPQNSPPLVQILAGSAQRRGDFTQAARLAQDSLSPAIRSAGGAETLNLVYAALADPARRPAAHAALEHLLRSVDQLDLDIVTRVEIIEWLTQTDALDSAYALADATIDQFARSGAVGNTWGFLWGEEMRPFRRDARFQGLVQRLKLVSEWQRNGAPDNCSLKEQQLNCV